MNEYSGGNYLVYRSSFLTTRVIGDYLEPVEFELEVGFQFGPTEAKTANDQNNEQTIASVSYTHLTLPTICSV